MPTPTLTAERLEDGTIDVRLSERTGPHHAHGIGVVFTHAQLSEAVTRLQAVLTNAEAADAEDAIFAGES